MLAIRFLRAGRKNRAFFRIVLTENSRPPKSNYIKELGWFDPHTKQLSLKGEDIIKCLDNGAKPSNSVAKLLLDNKIKHKLIVYKPDAPKTKKGKKDEASEKPAETPKDTVETDKKTEKEIETPPEDKKSEEPTEPVTKDEKNEIKAEKTESATSQKEKLENQPEADGKSQ